MIRIRYSQTMMEFLCRISLLSQLGAQNILRFMIMRWKTDGCANRIVVGNMDVQVLGNNCVRWEGSGPAGLPKGVEEV